MSKFANFEGSRKGKNPPFGAQMVTSIIEAHVQSNAISSIILELDVNVCARRLDKG
jgi:hypothetical protein